MGGREGLCEVVCWLPGKRKRGERETWERGKRKGGKTGNVEENAGERGGQPHLTPFFPLVGEGWGEEGKGKGVGLRGNS
jgi:hypothetical protein